jgi:hypothetical protein
MQHPERSIERCLFDAESKDADGATNHNYCNEPRPSTAFRKKRGTPLRMLSLFYDG